MPVVPDNSSGIQAKLEKQAELEKQIDSAIRATRELLHQRHDRRGPVRAHEPERRDGFDRRARVAPLKP